MVVMFRQLSGVVRVYVGLLGVVAVWCVLYSGAYRVFVFGWFVAGLLSWFGYFTLVERGCISIFYIYKFSLKKKHLIELNSDF